MFIGGVSRARAATTALLVSLVCALAVWQQTPRAQSSDPISYTVRIANPDKQYADVEAIVPTDGADSIDLMMPIWSPGYYRVEDYASKIEAFNARIPDGTALVSEQPKQNRWRIQTRGARRIVLRYRVLCAQRSVTTNWIDADYAVLNGAPTFITLVEQRRRPHDVQIELPPAWTHAMTGLDDVRDGKPHHFRAADYETLVDSPIVAGKLAVHEFEVAGKKHFVVGAG
ncbi:MAG TPA: hypothetical protein VEK56_13800, partial [Vicinamibacterales bacterium]|nr:hypothetical protein [Vicinamibacterales bacterium]